MLPLHRLKLLPTTGNAQDAGEAGDLHTELLLASNPDMASLQIKDKGAKAGVVLNPGTPLDSIDYVLDIVDLVLIMSGDPPYPFAPLQVMSYINVQSICSARLTWITTVMVF